MPRWKRILAVSLGAFALLAGIALASIWAPDRTVDELAERWAPPPSKFVEVRRLRVHVRDEGAGSATPLLLLHGTSASLHTWDGWVTELGSNRRIVRVDMPGFGLTGPAPDGDYTMQAYVDFVVALLDGLSMDEVIIAGNSFGGRVAWETAVVHPARVRGLILVDASGYPVDADSMPIGFTLAQLPITRDLMRVTLPHSVVESSVRNVYGDPSRVTPELVERYYELTLREGNRGALTQRFRQAPHGETADRIPEVRVPTLILWGSLDKLNPLSFAKRFHEDIEGSQLVILDGLGHVPHEEDPVTSAAVARTFMATLEGKPTHDPSGTKPSFAPRNP